MFSTRKIIALTLPVILGGVIGAASPSIGEAQEHRSIYQASVTRPAANYELGISGTRSSTSQNLQNGNFAYSGGLVSGAWQPATPLWNVRPVCKFRAIGVCRSDGLRMFSDPVFVSIANSFSWGSGPLANIKARELTLNADVRFGAGVQLPPLTEQSSTVENFSYLHPDGRDAEQDVLSFFGGHGFQESDTREFMVGQITMDELIGRWTPPSFLMRGSEAEGSEPPTKSELEQFTDNIKVSAEAKAKVKVSGDGIEVGAEAGVKVETSLTNIARGVGAAASATGRLISSWWYWTVERADAIGDGVVEAVTSGENYFILN